MISESPEAVRETPHGPVPACWGIMPLSECAKVQTGVAKGRKINAVDAVSVPYLRVANVQDGFLDLSEIKEITIRKDEITRYALQPGDVLLTEGGDFDKLGRGFVWHGQIAGCVHQNHIFAVRTNRGLLLPDFLAYLIQSPYGKSYFLSVAHKTTNLACINTTKLKAFPALIPPLPEQCAIAHVLRTVQRAKEATEQVLAAARQLKQSLMRHLFTYGPVPFARANTVPLKETEIGPVPEHWEVVRLADVAKLFSGGTPSKARTDYWEGPIPWASPKDMKQPRLYDTEDHISQPGLESGSRLAPAGAVFIVVRGMILSRDVPVVMAMRPMAFNQDMKAIVAGDRVTSPYLLDALRAFKNNLLRDISSAAHGTKRISTSAIEDILLPLPPFEEQERIASMLQAVDAKSQKEESRRKALNGLFESLLHNLMTGKVRVQDLYVKAADDV